MDKTGDKGEDGKEEDLDASCVVMRRSRAHIADISSGTSGDVVDGGSGKKSNKKKVKWSESTELRERLKIYRRSQIDLDLDYHHLAIEEEREREGVKRWRTILKKKETAEVDNDNTDEVEDCAPGAAYEGDSGWSIAVGGARGDAADFDSDEGEPEMDEAMEGRLQGIKEYTTRYTIYPAYGAAIPKYQDWLSKPENTKELTKDQLKNMKSQVALYKKLVEVYSEWVKQENPDTNSRFGEITKILQDASDLGLPPPCISQTIKEILTDEENVQKQVDVYNTMVQDMISALDNSTEV